jgi:D-glycero-D-manno-heptose 1,7-bisphosphate phosphatase
MGISDLTHGRGSLAAVFLDRDGTLNRAFVRAGVSYPPRTVEQLEVLPGVADGLAALKRCGFVLVVTTNQPDVARGQLPQSVADELNAELRRRLPVIDELRACYHDDADACACRKPKAGMLVDAAAAANVQLARSYMVGDSWKDVAAGRAAGCVTVQLRGVASNARDEQPPDAWVDTFSEAVDWIVARARAQAPSPERVDRGLRGALQSPEVRRIHG